MIIEKLGDECGKGLTWAKEQNEKLIKAKRYLKTQGNAHVTLKFLLTLENLYFTFSRQVHISQNSSVPDHCKTYALRTKTSSQNVMMNIRKGVTDVIYSLMLLLR